MEFSHDWKSPWPVAGVFRAPRLLAGDDAAAAALGPLSFRPASTADVTLLSFPDLAPDLPPLSSHPFALRSFCNYALIPLHLAPPSPPPPAPSETVLHNCLCALTRRDGRIAVFFPIGENSDGIGYVLMSFVDGKLELCACDGKDGFFRMPSRFYHKILKLSVSATDCCSFAVNGMAVEGILVACTLYSVRWFGIGSEIDGDGSSSKGLVLLSLGVVDFKSCVVYACLSQHMREESAVLLETGEVHLFDLSACFGASRLRKKLRGSRLKLGELDKLGLDKVEGKWLSCEFGWHPRIFILARDDAILMLDFREKERKMSVLAKVDVLNSVGVHSMDDDYFSAFCMAHFDAFYFSVATKHQLLVFDARQPLQPILQWDHWLDSPNNVNMFRMSELRPLSGDDKYNWAHQSGYVILLGSIWNCQYNIFCYGPLPPSDSSLPSAFSNFSCPYYAWGLPSQLSYSGDDCLCGDCLVREDFLQYNLPSGIEKCSLRWKNTILGFCIIVDMPGKGCDCTDLGGFTLIKLDVSGKLKSQRYQACDQLPDTKSSCHEADLPYLLDVYLSSLGRVSENFSRNRYRKLDYLLGYLNGNLANSTLAKMRRKILSTHNWSLTLPRHLFNSVTAPISKAIGCDVGTLDMLKVISFSSSVHEMALSKMWTGLPSEFLEMAFPKLQNLMVGGCRKEKFLKFLDVSDIYLGQMPPFILRKTLSANEKGYNQVFLSNDIFVGPVLPLPVLHASECIMSAAKSSPAVGAASGLFHEMGLENVCINIAKDVEDSLLENMDDTVSLSDEKDKWNDDKTFFTLEAGMKFWTEIVNEESAELRLVKEPCFKDGKPEVIVCRKRKASGSISEEDINGMEVFDDLCPLQLNFDCQATTFASGELQFYKRLKREFQKWQGGFKPYMDFCSSIT